MIDLDKLLELESKATPKDWDLNFYGGHLFLTYPIEGKFATSDDLELMTAMRNSIRELCLELKAYREKNVCPKNDTACFDAMIEGVSE